MWVCSAKNSAEWPRSSTSRARAPGAMALWVGKYPTPKSMFHCYNTARRDRITPAGNTAGCGRIARVAEVLDRHERRRRAELAGVSARLREVGIEPAFGPLTPTYDFYGKV